MGEKLFGRRQCSHHMTLKHRIALGVSVLVFSSTVAVSAPPTFVKAFPGNGVVTVAWRRVGSSTSYKLYRSTTAGNASPALLATVTASRPQPDLQNDDMLGTADEPDCGESAISLVLVDHADSTVTNGTTYYYRVATGTETTLSSEVSATPLSATSAITKGRFLKIMPLGNSITTGYSGSCAVGSYRDSLYKLLKKNGYQSVMVGAHITNGKGQSSTFIDQPCHEGWSERQTINLFKQVVGYAIPTYKPDIVLLEIGTNGTLFFSEDFGIAAPYFDSLVTRIHKLRPSTHIIVTPIPPPGDAATRPSRASLVNQYNTSIKAIVTAKAGQGKNISWLTEMDTYTWTSSDFSDMEHPSMSAHHKIASVWYRAIDALATGTATQAVRLSRSRVSPRVISERGMITASMHTDQPATLSVHSLLGRWVAGSNATPQNGQVTLKQALRPGVYFLTITSVTGSAGSTSIAVR